MSRQADSRPPARNQHAAEPTHWWILYLTAVMDMLPAHRVNKQTSSAEILQAPRDLRGQRLASPIGAASRATPSSVRSACPEWDS